jgi:hypothetical protein
MAQSSAKLVTIERRLADRDEVFGSGNDAAWIA